MRVETYTFDDDGRIPNSPLPVILYHGVSEATDAGTYEELFAKNGWLGAWRDGILGFHHFHSTAHEVLGIVRGHANVIVGGPSGQRFELVPGEVAVLPAGTGHCNAGSGGDLLVVGAYPDGMRWDIRRGDPDERDEVLANIARVPLPAEDPVEGSAGPLLELWRRIGVQGDPAVPLLGTQRQAAAGAHPVRTHPLTEDREPPGRGVRPGPAPEYTAGCVPGR